MIVFTGVCLLLYCFEGVRRLTVFIYRCVSVDLSPKFLAAQEVSYVALIRRFDDSTIDIFFLFSRINRLLVLAAHPPSIREGIRSAVSLFTGLALHRWFISGIFAHQDGNGIW